MRRAGCACQFDLADHLHFDGGRHSLPYGRMAPSGKWIDGIGADSSVAEAARRSLALRLAAVNHWLPRAAYLADHDVEHVHRLRVSTRRATAALRMYRGWVPRRRARRLKKWLKKIRRAAGEARDLDVLGSRLARDDGERSERVLAMIGQRRAAVQPTVVKIADRCRRRDRWNRKTARFVAGVRARRGSKRQPADFRTWASGRLVAVAEPFFAALPGESADAADLHRLRIRAKALRYTMELVASAFGPELRREHYPVVVELQERLGKIQDHVTAASRLREWADEVDDDALQEALRELAVEENARLDEESGEFHRWWTAERAESLRRGLMPQLAGEAATPLQPASSQT
jgi:CHAD domain-containing protein